MIARILTYNSEIWGGIPNQILILETARKSKRHGNVKVAEHSFAGGQR